MNGLWGLGALFLEAECFVVVVFLKTLWSEYESPIYSSLHLGKMYVFGPCIYLSNRHEKAGLLFLFSAYMVGNFANENKERATVPMLFRGLESFHGVNVTVSKLMISTVDSEFTSTCMGKESETLIYSCLMSVMRTS